MVWLYGSQATGTATNTSDIDIAVAFIQPLPDTLNKGQTPDDPISNIPYAAFKIRLKNSDNNKGKSGGYRVIYYLQHAEKTVLLTVYSKSHQEDIPDQELRQITGKYEK